MPIDLIERINGGERREIAVPTRIVPYRERSNRAFCRVAINQKHEPRTTHHPTKSNFIKIKSSKANNSNEGTAKIVSKSVTKTTRALPKYRRKHHEKG